MNDPNRLLGRPQRLHIEIAFADSRISKTDTDGTQKDAIERGGSIEVFPDAELAMGRAEYIQASLRTAGWEQSTTTSRTCSAVTGNLSPSKAPDNEEALG